ncbi:MAG: succinate dehydrogenase, cytochrome b556 subunit [Gammaproteobacteria bacterium]|nr:succinate dehydrogenase, cytochrome b556 subunit [Gammaproteobacteria bacterium]
MQKERPLSPHLQVYKPQLTSMLSVLHRGTGIFLALGSPLLVYWLWSIAEGPQAYSAVQNCLTHWFGQLVLLGWAYAFFYHLCNGIRHLFWDIGHGYEMETLYTSGKVVLVASLALTAGACFMAYRHMGGAL